MGTKQPQPPPDNLPTSRPVIPPPPPPKKKGHVSTPPTMNPVRDAIVAHWIAKSKRLERENEIMRAGYEHLIRTMEQQTDEMEYILLIAMDAIDPKMRCVIRELHDNIKRARTRVSDD